MGFLAGSRCLYAASKYSHLRPLLGFPPFPSTTLISPLDPPLATLASLWRSASHTCTCLTIGRRAVSAKGICRSINWPDGCITWQTPQDEGDSCARAAAGCLFRGCCLLPQLLLARRNLLGEFPGLQSLFDSNLSLSALSDCINLHIAYPKTAKK